MFQLSVDRCRIANEPHALAVESVRVEEAFEAEADTHRPIIDHQAIHQALCNVSLLATAAIGRLRASGGQPCLLRPRQEPIEPPS
jgi:hypothetical protein